MRIDDLEFDKPAMITKVTQFNPKEVRSWLTKFMFGSSRLGVRRRLK